MTTNDSRKQTFLISLIFLCLIFTFFAPKGYAQQTENTCPAPEEYQFPCCSLDTTTPPSFIKTIIISILEVIAKISPVKFIVSSDQAKISEQIGKDTAFFIHSPEISQSTAINVEKENINPLDPYDCGPVCKLTPPDLAEKIAENAEALRNEDTVWSVNFDLGQDSAVELAGGSTKEIKALDISATCIRDALVGNPEKGDGSCEQLVDHTLAQINQKPSESNPFANLPTTNQEALLPENNVLPAQISADDEYCDDEYPSEIEDTCLSSSRKILNSLELLELLKNALKIDIRPAGSRFDRITRFLSGGPIPEGNKVIAASTLSADTQVVPAREDPQYESGGAFDTFLSPIAGRYDRLAAPGDVTMDLSLEVLGKTFHITTISDPDMQFFGVGSVTPALNSPGDPVVAELATSTLTSDEENSPAGVWANLCPPDLYVEDPEKCGLAAVKVEPRPPKEMGDFTVVKTAAPTQIPNEELPKDIEFEIKITAKYKSKNVTISNDTTVTKKDGTSFKIDKDKDRNDITQWPKTGEPQIDLNAGDTWSTSYLITATKGNFEDSTIVDTVNVNAEQIGPEPGFHCATGGDAILPPDATLKLLPARNKTNVCYTPTAVILHWSGQFTDHNNQNTYTTLVDSADALSCQYGTDDKSGTNGTWQMLEMFETAIEKSACTGKAEYNRHGINIEIAGTNFDNEADPNLGPHNPPTQQQYERTLELTCFFLNKYNLPVSQIFGHIELKGSGKPDPGRQFSRKFREDIQKRCP